MYNTELLITRCIDRLNALITIDENRNYKFVENYEERRREIWRTMACPTNYLWKRRTKDTPMRKVEAYFYINSKIIEQ